MKTCRTCKTRFESSRPFQTWCSLACGTVQASQKLAKWHAKKAAAERKADKEKAKRRSDHLQDTQRAFNAYICKRDAHLPCVSCGCLESPGWHASHYRSVGSSPALRFDPANVHRACVKCNLHLHGNPIPYRVELLRRIGPVELERLEGPQPVKKWAVEELKSMTKDFRAKAKELQR